MNRMINDAVLGVYSALESAGLRQLQNSDNPDRGHRAEATSGLHLDSLAYQIQLDLQQQGVPAEMIHEGRGVDLRLPGYYRRTKDWDLTIVTDNLEHDLVATIELKSINSSFGNNSNNRIEEALGSITDARAAIRHDLYGSRAYPPMFGYVMVVKACAESMRKTSEPNALYPIDPAFQNTSYMERFTVFCERILVEKLYDAVWLVAADPETGKVWEPSPMLTYERFIATIAAAWRIHEA
ncbi:hypothetical protein BAAM0483_02340 [Bifidobacterium animalis subsp. animalis MCC 0483]|uniref:Restriction endonuclease XhoI n=1 Tax=Bifidobacterium animalis subsp. animalis MCC 0483 TaxID=1365955 RepID=A0AB34TB88_9BIFI|nr:PaeR7I family type II restriction endonuclease [Bifidobacterium animalis]KOA51092.1 hypothetical protein BAAM0483_02340 [Bifidobacterium animalis subsp. animalis MCC 0483]